MEEKLEKKPTEPETQDSKVQDEDLDGVAGGGTPEIMGLWSGESEDKDDPWSQH